ncbi:unnamed protein product [Adineta ricciae]|uniref:protein-tyrosine-phosphatase n=1 Tax=Adineta ricciae TaxID=249248 RepID=A0A813ZWV0_ADIRI|nr:unnamed protein product [Adineta ricciae]
MPGTRAIERNSVPLPVTAQKTYTFTARIPSQCNSMNRNNLISDKVSRKSNVSSKNLSTTTLTQNHTMLSSRRSHPNEVSTPRGRSNTDVQSVTSSVNGLKQQQQQLNGSGSDKSVNHNQQQRQSPPPPPKTECTLPSSGCQAECVTPSKLFNMMGYGLQNQYLFMHVHYLYLIDCRSREDFNQSHIITAIHWEDALNGNVYISLVERFSEIVLYDAKGVSPNTSSEMRRIISRFSTSNARTCPTLAGGFEAFRLSFPFVCTQSDVRSAVDREKFLTIYPSVVLDNQLYLGTGNQAANWKIVRDLKITHIINISIEHQCVFNDKIKYLHLELEDSEDVCLKDCFHEAVQFIESALENSSNRVLVHCHLGISRSTTLVLAYLMKTYHATVHEAFRFLRHRRPIVCPNIGFLRQLIEFENELYAHVYTDVNDAIFY